MELKYGAMTPVAIGIIMREAVRRATFKISEIHNDGNIEAATKVGYDGVADDVVTKADKAAQEIYLKVIKRCFPDYGIDAEEGLLSVPGKFGCRLRFTVDPLDGTRAYKRFEEHGIATMVSLIEDDGTTAKVIAAFVGDVKTGKIYGYRPASDEVGLLINFNVPKKMRKDKCDPLEKSYVMLRDPIGDHRPETQLLINGAFKGHSVDGGSIGTWMARMWRRSVGAAIMQPGNETPWDLSPIYGISRELGYVFLRPIEGTNGWEYFEPPLVRQVYRRDHEVLVVHLSNIDELQKNKTCGGIKIPNHLQGLL